MEAASLFHLNFVQYHCYPWYRIILWGERVVQTHALYIIYMRNYYSYIVIWILFYDWVKWCKSFIHSLTSCAGGSRGMVVTVHPYKHVYMYMCIVCMCMYMYVCVYMVRAVCVEVLSSSPASQCHPSHPLPPHSTHLPRLRNLFWSPNTSTYVL